MKPADGNVFVMRVVNPDMSSSHGFVWPGVDQEAVAPDFEAAGNYGTASAGNYGTASAGKKGSILVRKWYESAERYRWILGEVGENGIEANTKYKLDDSGKLVKA